ncbi:hypothetical protein LRQ04_14340 [Paenarthrobacter sp. AR 02]|uniref:hypothetical protein n=1 Tax=Paenarthrobacter sp. AR 02 TaxID=2899821 RepID=UPI001F228FD5|nr:hypothetical protein [Paenarthrobacter sp. AR 02]MCF3140436.1 hypothetical protein [Paenarthrobacter sp. AR 02]
MQDDSGFYAPLHYQQLWLWLGLLLVLLVAAWYAWVLWPARPEKTARLEAVARPTLDTLRNTCVAAIQATASDADAGRLPEREAHQRLSFLVREFAGSATGLPITSMTLEELRGHGLADLATGIARIYPNEFAPMPVQTVSQSAVAARQVVLEWN